MKNRILAPLIAFCLLAALYTPAFAQDDPMDVFKPLIGEWKTTSIVQPSPTNPEKSTGTGEITVESILGGRFVRYEGSGTTSTGVRLEYQAIMTYDERQGTYRRWVFRSDGVTAEATGAWNADKKALVWTTIGLPENIRFTATTRITDSGFEETLRRELADGTVTFDLTTTASKK